MRTWTVMVLAVALGCTAEESEGPVGINEVGDAWFEVYASEPADLTGWVAEVGAASVALDASLATGEVVLFDGLDPIPAGPITVRNADGEVVQTIDFPTLGDGESYGRVPDGIANWQLIDAPTPGALNTP